MNPPKKPKSRQEILKKQQQSTLEADPDSPQGFSAFSEKSIACPISPSRGTTQNVRPRLPFHCWSNGSIPACPTKAC